MHIKGQVWLFGDNIDTDQILPGYAMTEPSEKLAKYAMTGSIIPDFSTKVNQGDIIIAGKNFGCGSSREQAPVALFKAGISLIIAESFARIFRRNAINIGLPVFTANLTGKIKNGDFIAVDVAKGLLVLNNQELQYNPLSENVLATLRAGGLIARVRQELGLT
ncbi:MAG: 3-isopropylmalate dehydratase [Peptococcaceae bacterium]